MHVSDLESFCFLQVVKFASKEDRSTPAVTDVDIGIVGYVCMHGEKSVQHSFLVLDVSLSDLGIYIKPWLLVNYH